MALLISELARAKVDQLIADDLKHRDLVATITGAREGNAEQRLVLALDSWPQPWKPCKTMQRLLGEAWGDDAEQWVGRRVHLYRDETVKFDKDRGGVRVRAISHISHPVSARLTVSRGKRKTYTVVPLVEEKPPTLASMCEQHGITPEGLDKWHRAQFDGKPAPADGSDTAAELAAYLPTNTEWLTAAKRASSTIMGTEQGHGSEE